MNHKEEDDNETASKIFTLPSNRSLFGREKFSQEVALFLVGQGMGKYMEQFKAQNISLEQLQHLTEEELEAIGVEEAGDRQQLLNSIQLRSRGHIRADAHRKQPAVPPSPYEDLVIAKNLLMQTQRIDQNLYHLTRQLRERRPQDYYVKDTKGRHTALSLAKLVLHKAVQQTQIIRTNVYQPHGDALIHEILQKEGQPLPTKIQKILDGRRGSWKRGLLLSALSFTGICSLSVFIYRHLLASQQTTS